MGKGLSGERPALRGQDDLAMRIPTKDYDLARARIDVLAQAVKDGRARRPIMFTHNDLDAAGSAVMFKARFGKSADVVFCALGGIDQEIATYLGTHEATPEKRRFIVMSDLSVGPELAARLSAYDRDGPGALLLDHHVTEMALNEHPWAYVDPRACGALHSYRVLRPGEAYAELAALIDDYDRWLRRDPRSDTLNQLCMTLGLRRFLKRFLADPRVELDETERLLVELENEARERAVKKARRTVEIFVLETGARLGVGYAQHYMSDVAHAILEELRLDAVAMIDVTGGRVSLRGREGVDVGSIGLALEGGGHTAAAGYNNPVFQTRLAELRRSVHADIAAALSKIPAAIPPRPSGEGAAAAE